MTKDWFIFKGTHHLGPFSIEEVASLYQDKQIQAQTLVWREGETKWDSLKNIPAFAFLFSPVKKPEEQILEKKQEIKSEFDLPPPMPEIPTLPKSGPINLEESEDELPPPIPLDAIFARNELKSNHEITKDRFDFQFKKWIGLGLSIIFIFTLVWYWNNEKISDVHLKIKGIMPIYLEKLELVATTRSSSFQAMVALSLDGNVLWASTNLPYKMQTIIKLESIPKRVLGKESVVVSMKGEFEHHLGKFNRMILVNGGKFYSGEYRVQVEAKEIHWLNRKFKFLSGFPVFQTLNKIHKYKTTALIFSGTPRDFEKRITDYREKMLAEALKPYQEKLEILKTLESLLNTTTQNYLMELDHGKNGRSIKVFEKTYTKEIAPLLQSLIIKTNDLMKVESFNEIEDKDSLFPHRDLVVLGKQIGELAADMVSKTSKIKVLTASDKIKLKAEFERKARAIKIQIDLGLRKVGDKIQSLVLN